MNNRDQSLIDQYVRGSLSIPDQTEFDSRFSSDPNFSEQAVLALGAVMGQPDPSYLEAAASRLDLKAAGIWAKAGYMPALSGSFGVRTLTAALLLFFGAFLTILWNRPALQTASGLSTAAPRVMLAFNLSSGEVPTWKPRNILGESDAIPSAMTRECPKARSAVPAVKNASETSETPDLSGDIPTTVQGRTLRIRIEVPREVKGRVTLYDSDGKLIRHLFEGPMPAGTWALDWDQKNDSGSRVNAGAYIVQIDADGKVMSGRVSVSPGS
jgi:hypothetical protein